MVNFLKQSGGNRTTDLLREQLAQSAAQRVGAAFERKDNPPVPQAPAPPPSFLMNAAPALAQAAGNTVGLGGQFLQQQAQAQRKQQEVQQVAQAIKQRYPELSEEDAMGIASLPEERLKEVMSSLDKEKQEIAKQSGKRALAEEAFERQKELTYLKASLKGNDTVTAKDKKHYLNGLNAVKELEKFKDVGFGTPLLGRAYGWNPYEKEDEVRSALVKAAAAQGKLIGLTAGQQNELVDRYVDNFYKDPESRNQLYRTLHVDFNPDNREDIQEQVRMLNESQQMQQTQQQAMPQDQAEGRSQLGRAGEFLGKKAAHLAAGVGSLAGLPGNIQQMAEQPFRGADTSPAGQTAGLEDIDPELRAQIIRDIENQTPSAKAENPIQLPTSEDVREGIKGVLPKGWLDNPDIVDKAFESVGQDLPILALSAATGGTAALWQPIARSIAAGATTESIKKAGGGPVAQFFGGLASAILVDKGFRSAGEGTLQSLQSSELTKVVDKMYDAARTEGAKTRIPTAPFAERLEEVGRKVFGPVSTLGKSASDELKHMVENFQPLAKGESVLLPDLIEYQRALNAQIRELPAKAAKEASKLNTGINEMIALVPSAPGVKEYNIGKNIYSAVNSMNMIEKQIYNITNTKTRAGLGAAGTFIAGLIGIKKAPLLAGVGAAALGGKSVYRQLSNLYNLPQARKIGLNAIKALVSGDTAKGQRNILALARLATSKENKSNR